MLKNGNKEIVERQMQLAKTGRQSFGQPGESNQTVGSIQGKRSAQEFHLVPDTKLTQYTASYPFLKVL